MTDDEYINEYHCFGEEVGKTAYDIEKTEWFSCLKPIFPELKNNLLKSRIGMKRMFYAIYL